VTYGQEKKECCQILNEEKNYSCQQQRRQIKTEDHGRGGTAREAGGKRDGI
jgi:hypothetical protein